MHEPTHSRVSSTVCWKETTMAHPAQEMFFSAVGEVERWPEINSKRYKSSHSSNYWISPYGNLPCAVWSVNLLPKQYRPSQYPQPMIEMMLWTLSEKKVWKVPKKVQTLVTGVESNSIGVRIGEIRAMCHGLACLYVFWFLFWLVCTLTEVCYFAVQ